MRDTMRLLGHVRNGHKHVFFKFQDATTLRLVRKRAFGAARGGSTVAKGRMGREA